MKDTILLYLIISYIIGLGTCVDIYTEKEEEEDRIVPNWLLLLIFISSPLLVPFGIGFNLRK